MSKKIDTDFVREAFDNPKCVLDYEEAVFDIGLWVSERIMFIKYINTDDYILDLGCGAGRTTFGLYKRGYHLIEGLDISENMINRAKEISTKMNYKINFHTGNAISLDFKDDTFNIAIFSFNGLMHIPGIDNRKKAMYEIMRVMKSGGYFIFTTYDRDMKKNFWDIEMNKWERGEQDKRLLEFGDRIDEFSGITMFNHIPSRDEIISCTKEVGFILVEDIIRSQICDEPPEIKAFSDDARFWVLQKPV